MNETNGAEPTESPSPIRQVVDRQVVDRYTESAGRNGLELGPRYERSIWPSFLFEHQLSLDPSAVALLQSGPIALILD
jgi:hypothetical protein